MNKKPQAQVRSIPTAAVAKFVAGNRVEPTENTPSGRPRRKGGIQHRITKGDQDVLQIYLPVELGRRLRMFAAAERTTLSEAVEQALLIYFDRRRVSAAPAPSEH